MTTVLSVENLSKSYKLGQIGTGTFSRDIEIWWARRRGKPNPFLKIGQTDDASLEGETLWALKDVSFDVQQGEVLGIIGRNGAGKSTLLKILSRVTAPTSGVVKVKGRIASLLEVGTGFHPELTGRENIYLNGAILGMSKQEVARKFDEIVAFAEVEKFIDTPVKRYSSGMYVRLAFAVAAHLESEILLVDEVLAVGDAEFQKKCLGKMGDVAEQEGRTVLFVSHIMAAVEYLCNSGIILDKGAATNKSNVEQTITYYLTRNNNARESLIDISRTGSGKIKFENWYVIDSRYGKGKKVQPLSETIFVLDYFATRSVANVNVTLTIKDKLGHPIISGLHSYEEELIPLKGSFTCKFKKLNLLPGKYTVRLWCAIKNEPADLIIDAGILEVVAEDIFGNGKLSREDKHGHIFVENEWLINTEV